MRAGSIPGTSSISSCCLTPLFAVLASVIPAISELWLGHYEPQFVIMGVVLAVAWYLNSVTAPVVLCLPRARPAPLVDRGAPRPGHRQRVAGRRARTSLRLAGRDRRLCRQPGGGQFHPGLDVSPGARAERAHRPLAQRPVVAGRLRERRRRRARGLRGGPAVRHGAVDPHRPWLAATTAAIAVAAWRHPLTGTCSGWRAAAPEA